MRPALALMLVLLVGCAARGVPLQPLLAVEEELAEQAGTTLPAGMLLDAVAKVAHAPADRAEIARRRCGLAWAMQGAEAALPGCREAARLGSTAGGEARHRGLQRLSLVLSAAGQGAEAQQIADALELPADPLGAALLWWARGLALQAQGRSSAVAMRTARGLLEEAARRDPKRDEFLAIADLRLGEALAADGKTAEAREVLQRGIVRQRALDAANPEYAEYRLYLVRLLRALGRLPGEDAARDEGRRLGAALLARDPLRAEYQAVAP